MWDQQLLDFGRVRDVIDLDLPGHGLSAGLGTTPTFDAFARAVADVVRHLDVGPVDLVGISFGGMVAQTFAVRDLGLIPSLTLVATSCTFADSVRFAIRQRAALTRTEGMAVVAASHLQRWFSEDYRGRRPDTLDCVNKVVLRQAPELHAALWEEVAGSTSTACPP